MRHMIRYCATGAVGVRAARDRRRRRRVFRVAKVAGEREPHRRPARQHAGAPWKRDPVCRAVVVLSYTNLSIHFPQLTRIDSVSTLCT